MKSIVMTIIVCSMFGLLQSSFASVEEYYGGFGEDFEENPCNISLNMNMTNESLSFSLDNSSNSIFEFYLLVEADGEEVRISKNLSNQDVLQVKFEDFYEENYTITSLVFQGEDLCFYEENIAGFSGMGEVRETNSTSQEEIYISSQKEVLLQVSSIEYNTTSGNTSVLIENLGSETALFSNITFLNENFSELSSTQIEIFYSNSLKELQVQLEKNLSEFFVLLELDTKRYVQLNEELLFLTYPNLLVEVCGDNKDNNRNGEIDEGCLIPKVSSSKGGSSSSSSSKSSSTNQKEVLKEESNPSLEVSLSNLGGGEESKSEGENKEVNLTEDILLNTSSTTISSSNSSLGFTTKNNFKEENNTTQQLQQATNSSTIEKEQEEVEVPSSLYISLGVFISTVLGAIGVLLFA